MLLAWIFLLAHGSRGQTVDHGEALRPRDAQRAGLWLRPVGSQEAYRPALELSSSIRLKVAGLVARVGVDQRFSNPGSTPVEAIYVFPLPEGAAVDTLELEAGGERIVGEVRERVQAKQEYEQAKAEGRRASLLEQQRPNLFTVSVAGIAAGETVSVHVEFQELARYADGAFRLRLPLVAGPRYEPVAAAVVASAVENSRAFGVESRGERTAGEPLAQPAVDRRLDPRSRPVDLVAEIDAGVPLAKVESSTHRIRVLRAAGAAVEVRLEGGVTPADRDLELVWTPQRQTAPQLVRFEEVRDGEPYVALLFLPPAAEAPAIAAPRELVVVLDTSGSMAGTSLEQAKHAVALALARLEPWDRFNVLRFSDRAERLFPESVAATPDAVERARAWVAGLEVNGGTNIADALEAAFADAAGSADLRQILLVTDGCVGNEQELFERIAAQLGDDRLFTVGIGSAPNGYFMTRAAELGRGTFTYVARVEEVAEKMGALFARLERPALVDLEIAWNDGVAESYPAKIPDLYAGEPVLVLARLAKGDAAATISGQRAGAPFHATLAAARAIPAAGIARLWARRKVDALEGAGREPGADQDALRAERVALAIDHRLLTRETSFVAVARTPSFDPSALARRDVSTLRPAGWTLGDLPQGGTRASLSLLLALALGMAAIATARFGSQR
jgi:Ca-activated chloride channel family protein